MHPGTGCNKQLGPRSVTLVVFVALLAYKVDAKSKVDSVKSSAGSETFSAACIGRKSGTSFIPPPVPLPAHGDLLFIWTWTLTRAKGP
jgi:hypothetical protein